MIIIRQRFFLTAEIPHADIRIFLLFPPLAHLCGEGGALPHTPAFLRLTTSSFVKHFFVCLMTTPVVQIDDRNQLVFFSPNSSWIRGGAAGDFDGTSTLTSATGASATLTFTGMHFHFPSFLPQIQIIDRPKAQGLVYGAQFNSCNLIRLHMCCRPIVSMVDLRRSSMLRKQQHSNSSKNYFNLIRYPTMSRILLS